MDLTWDFLSLLQQAAQSQTRRASGFLESLAPFPRQHEAEPVSGVILCREGLSGQADGGFDNLTYGQKPEPDSLERVLGVTERSVARYETTCAFLVKT